MHLKKTQGMIAELNYKINKMIRLSEKNGILIQPETIQRLEKRKKLILKKQK